MTDIVQLKDADGRVHYTARDSVAAEKLLKAGAEDLDPPPATAVGDDPTTAGVTDAASTGQGDDHDTGTTGGGSGKRQRKAGAPDSGDGSTGEV